MSEKEEKVLILLMTVYNSKEPVKLGTVCKQVELHPVYATVLNQNDFLTKCSGGKFTWNQEKPRPNPYMVEAVIDSVKTYQNICGKSSRQKNKENSAPKAEIKLPAVDKEKIENFSKPRTSWWKNLFRWK